MTRMFGLGDEFGEDAILGRMEGMKDVIEQVNMQFKDPVRFNSYSFVGKKEKTFIFPVCYNGLIAISFFLQFFPPFWVSCFPVRVNFVHCKADLIKGREGKRVGWWCPGLGSWCEGKKRCSEYSSSSSESLCLLVLAIACNLWQQGLALWLPKLSLMLPFSDRT